VSSDSGSDRPIPNDYHFIFGLRPDFAGKPFSLVHYLALASCRAVNRPRSMNFYYRYEPAGYWWERVKPLLNLVRIEPPVSIFGNQLTHAAHMADVLRLDILIERGGVYLDLDVICIRPFAALMDFDMVLGEEYGMGLCNAVMLARPGMPFLLRWRDAYRSFDSREWNVHSVKLPYLLAKQAPDQIQVVDYKRFFWPMYWPEHQRAFFLEPGSSFCAESFCVHLWESFTWDYLEGLTVSGIETGESEFYALVRPFLVPEPIA
jgi:hypothetical protein